jgi:hypothetical protein
MEIFSLVMTTTEGSFFEKKRTGVQISKNGGDVVFDL